MYTAYFNTPVADLDVMRFKPLQNSGLYLSRSFIGHGELYK